MADVDITQSGRGGTIYYREHQHVAVFDWEFAGGNAVALLFGTNAAGWDAAHPWAVGRQQEVYDTVGREVVRQQVPNGSYEVDLARGDITVYSAKREAPRAARPRAPKKPKAPKQTSAYARFVASMIPLWAHWDEGATYDVGGVAEMTDAERDAGVELLASRDVAWREVDALAAFDTPRARLHVLEALEARLSVETRLAAAEAALRWDASFAIGATIVRELHAIHDARDGLTRVLRLAEAHDSAGVRDALLYATWNQTHCSSACAALLVRLTGGAVAPSVIENIGFYHNYFERKAAFDEICRVTRMTLAS